jgi:hypothetical protein
MDISRHVHSAMEWELPALSHLAVVAEHLAGQPDGTVGLDLFFGKNKACDL